MVRPAASGFRCPLAATLTGLLAVTACCALLARPVAAQDAPRGGGEAGAGRSAAHESRHDGRRGPLHRLGGRIARRVEGRDARAESRHGQHRKLADEIGVTRSQRDLLREARDQHRASLGEARDETRAAREALHAAAQSSPADAAALHAASERLADALALQAERREALRAEARSILTPQQGEAVEAARADRRAARGARQSLRQDLRHVLRERHAPRSEQPAPR